jgi:hypothetical protein
MRDVREIGDERNRIAALVATGKVRPFSVISVDLERAEMAIGATRIERYNLRADALASGEDTRQDSREALRG